MKLDVSENSFKFFCANRKRGEDFPLREIARIASMKCPACPSSQLRPLTLRAGLEAEVCGACQGAWLDRSEIYQFVKNVGRLQEELAAAYGTAKPSARPCPRCGRGLAEVRVASAEVSFEACPGCEGNWFDSEEIARLRQAVDHPPPPEAPLKPKAEATGKPAAPVHAASAKAATEKPAPPRAASPPEPAPPAVPDKPSPATFSVTNPPETGTFLALLLGGCGLLAFLAGWAIYFVSPGSIRAGDLWIAGGIFAAVTVVAYLVLSFKK